MNGDRKYREQETVSFFAKHLVGLSIEYESLNDDGSVHHRGYTVISGFIIDLLGAWHWVTAGHCLTTDLDDLILIRNGHLRLLSTRFVDYFGDGSVSREPYPHAYELGSAIAEYKPEIGLDFALLLLNELEQEAFAKNGVVPVRRENWMHHASLAYDGYYVMGFPVSQIHDITIDQQPFPYTGVSLIAITQIDRSELSNPPSEHWFLGRIHEKADIADIAGVSGGPILGLRKLPDGRSVYHVVGIQSSWRPKERSFMQPISRFWRRCPTRQI